MRRRFTDKESGSKGDGKKKWSLLEGPGTEKTLEQGSQCKKGIQKAKKRRETYEMESDKVRVGVSWKESRNDG